MDILTGVWSICGGDVDGGLRLRSDSIDWSRLGRVATDEVTVVVLSVEMVTADEA